MKLSSLPLIVLTAVSCFGQWPAPKSAMDAYDFVQGRRNEAEKLWTQGDTARGFAILNDTLAYLDQPLVKDLAAGNRYLEARRANIYLDFAEAYAMQGKAREAVDYLAKFAEDRAEEPSFAGVLEKAPHFATLRGDTGFQTILARLRRFDHFWDSASLHTAFRENLPDNEKLAGLSKFWAEVKYNFAYPEKLVELDWDRVYLNAIPEVLTTSSTAEYYRVLMRLCARLGDGHTNVYPPAGLDATAKPPIRTGLVEGHVMILDVLSPSLEARDIRPGVEILEVDGVPAVEYARRDVQPYQSAATPQDLENRTFWYGFLRGPSKQPVRLRLRDAAGREFEQSLERRGYQDARKTSPLTWRMLPESNIAYVALNDFSTEDLVKQWNETLPKISGAKAMIVDVRLNGGGSSGIGYQVIRSLVERPVLTSRVTMRRYNPTERARGTLMDWTEFQADTLEPSQGAHFGGPVVVLIGPATYSAAEDFLVAWKNSGRGKMIGEASGGSTGQPLFFQLPGDGSARVCTKRDTFPDGTVWIGKGIEPDIAVKPTVADARAGRDTVLERAIAEIGQGLKVGPK